jgi:hypothetical protein
MNEKEKSTFIKIDKFDEVTAALSVIKKKLMDSKNTLQKIVDLKQEEDAAVEKWTNDLVTVHQKVEEIESQITNEQ